MARRPRERLRERPAERPIDRVSKRVTEGARERLGDERPGDDSNGRVRARLLKARFPRLRQIRQEQLGWEIVDILSRLPANKPSISSIYRLEQGEAIRMSSARRVFDVINGALHNTLDVSKELEMSW